MRPSGPTDSDQQVSDSGFCVKGYHFVAYGAVCAAAADAAIPAETVLIKSRRCNLALLMIAPPFTYRCRVDPAGKREQGRSKKRGGTLSRAAWRTASHSPPEIPNGRLSFQEARSQPPNHSLQWQSSTIACARRGNPRAVGCPEAATLDGWVMRVGE